MKNILAVDIGSGTQDILIYQPGVEVENNVKLILPSQTQIVARQIKKLTEEGRDIFAYGYLMGGGSSSGAISKHLQRGFKVYATPDAALTIKDNLEQVAARGVVLADSAPGGFARVEFKDLDIPALKKTLALFFVDLPQVFAFAVQDHGYSPERSNREFRFEHWRNFLSSGGNLASLIYNRSNLPGYLTRMKAVLQYSSQFGKEVWLMDTGAAAILGSLEDPVVSKAAQDGGCMLVNVGNQHTIAFLVANNYVYGVFEHHTGLLSENKLANYLKRFQQGNLGHTEVYNDNGHGSAILPDAKNYKFDFISITGPRRKLAADLGYMAVPHGDMMISGAAGLVRGVLNNNATR